MLLSHLVWSLAILWSLLRCVLRSLLRSLLWHLRSVHDALVLLRRLIILLNLWVVLELVCCLAHDVLNPRVEHWHVVAVHANVYEYIRPQYIVHVVCDKRCDKLVHTTVDIFVLGCEASVHGIHVLAVHYRLVVLVHEVIALVHQAGKLLAEFSQLVVEWRARD